MQELLEEALATLVPSVEEQATVEAICESLLARAREAAPDGVEPTLSRVGRRWLDERGG